MLRSWAMKMGSPPGVKLQTALAAHAGENLNSEVKHPNLVHAENEAVQARSFIHTYLSVPASPFSVILAFSAAFIAVFVLASYLVLVKLYLFDQPGGRTDRCFSRSGAPAKARRNEGKRISGFFHSRIVGCKEALAKISSALSALEESNVIELVREALEAGCSALEIIEEGLTPGIREVGARFEKGEYFLPELMISAEIFNKAVSLLQPLLEKSAAQTRRGRVVIGTVKGDIHDLGKNLVATMLRVDGFEVIDLGVDVPAEKFVEAVRQFKPDIVGMSALLTTTMLEMKNVIDALKSAGLRESVKVIVGGAPVTEAYAKEIGADAYAKDAVEAVEKCRALVSRT